MLGEEEGRGGMPSVLDPQPAPHPMVLGRAAPPESPGPSRNLLPRLLPSLLWAAAPPLYASFLPLSRLFSASFAAALRAAALLLAYLLEAKNTPQTPSQVINFFSFAIIA